MFNTLLNKETENNQIKRDILFFINNLVCIINKDQDYIDSMTS